MAGGLVVKCSFLQAAQVPRSTKDGSFVSSTFLYTQVKINSAAISKIAQGEESFLKNLFTPLSPLMKLTFPNSTLC